MEKAYRTISIIVVVGIILVGGFHELNSYIRGQELGGRVSLPTFDDYKISDIYTGVLATPDFSTKPEAKNFVTAITNGAKEGPNFAGHYTVVSWGCGTSCQASAIIDAKTGAIVVYGLLNAYGLDYQLGSNLLIVNPKKNIPDNLLKDMQHVPGEHYPLGAVPGGADYYVFDNGDLKYLDRYSFVNNEGAVCAQVVVPGRNPVTGETRDFGSPCSLPFGWEALETAEGTM